MSFKGVTVSDPSVDRIKWTEVEQHEYDTAHFETPHRVTIIGLNTVRLELGVIPITAPKKLGAIVVDPGDLNSGFYVYDGDEWYFHSASDYFSVSEKTIEGGLNNGFTVAFEGIE